MTRGGFEYGRNGFTWLAMGSYINKLKNMWIHRLIIHYQIMTRITYIKSETVTGNLFGYYKMNDEAENVVVFSNKYFLGNIKYYQKRI